MNHYSLPSYKYCTLTRFDINCRDCQAGYIEPTESQFHYIPCTDLVVSVGESHHVDHLGTVRMSGIVCLCCVCKRRRI